MKKQTKAAAASFAKANPRTVSRRRCAICADQEMSDFVETVVRMKVAGQSTVTWAQLHRHLRDEYDLNRAVDALKRHIQHALPKEWKSLSDY